MTETRWTVKTPDGHLIYGVLNSPAKKKNTKAILHIHGLTGCETDYNAVCLAKALPELGYDVIRPNLYWWMPKARSLPDCTIQTHAEDINLLVKHFKKKYKKLYATGHSYGGPSLMMSNINQFNAVSLWDPSFYPAKTWRKSDFKKFGNYFISTEDTGAVYGKDFIEEAVSFTKKRAIALAKECIKPLQVIYGGQPDSVWIKEGESYHTYSNGPTNEKIIWESLHCFYEEGATEKLLQYTKKWFDKF